MLGSPSLTHRFLLDDAEQLARAMVFAKVLNLNSRSIPIRVVLSDHFPPEINTKASFFVASFVPEDH